jgi:DNA-binding response OmpR family regulator
MKRVHLVEDDDGIAELVEGCLAREGLRVDR